MIVNGETAFLLLRAKSYMASVEMELERSQKDIYAASTAAFNLAMAAELTLKHVLLSNGIEPSRTHNHAQLMKKCGMNHILIPKNMRLIAIDLRTWESTARYDSGVVIMKEEVEEGYQIVKEYMAKIYEIFIDSAYEIISKKLPQKELGERTREEMVKDHLSLL